MKPPEPGWCAPRVDARCVTRERRIAPSLGAIQLKAASIYTWSKAMRTIHLIPLVLAFGIAQMIPLAPAHAATTVRGSKSNSSEKVSKPPRHHKPCCVKGSKSNSDN
jgi:hypothetical protein